MISYKVPLFILIQLTMINWCRLVILLWCIPSLPGHTMRDHISATATNSKA